MKTSLAVIIVFSLMFTPISRAQEKSDSTSRHTQEVAGKIPELDAFHKLIHPLVHVAYPKNDFTTIRKAIPDLLKASKSMKSAKLPASLQEKKDEYTKYSKKLVEQLTDLNKKKDKLSDKEFGTKFMEMHETFESIMGVVG